MEASSHVLILERNRNLLVENLVLTEELCALLVEQKALTQSMIHEAKDQTKKEEQNAVILDNIARMGRPAFRKFYNMLYLTGQKLLGDTLKEEDIEEKTDNKLGAELSQKLPFLQRKMQDKEMRQLILFINTKVTEAVKRTTWQQGSDERTRALRDRQEFLEKELSTTRSLKDKDKRISVLEEQARAGQEELGVAGEALQAARDELTQLQHAHHTQMSVLLTSNTAAETCIQRLNHRLQLFDNQVNELAVKMEVFQEEEEDEEEEECIVTNDSDTVKKSHLEEVTTRIFQKVKQIQEANEEQESSQESQRKHLLKYMKVTDTGQSLAKAYLEAATKAEQDKIDVMSYVTKLCQRLCISGNSTDKVVEDQDDTGALSTDEEMLEALHRHALSPTDIIIQIEKLGQQVHNVREYNELKNQRIGRLEKEVKDLHEKLQQHGDPGSSPGESLSPVLPAHTWLTRGDRSPRPNQLPPVTLPPDSPSPPVIIMDDPRPQVEEELSTARERRREPHYMSPVQRRRASASTAPAPRQPATDKRKRMSVSNISMLSTALPAPAPSTAPSTAPGFHTNTDRRMNPSPRARIPPGHVAKPATKHNQ